MNIAASVLVRVSGPDARRTRGSAAGYKVHEGARTYLSCSGVLLAPLDDASTRRFVVCNGGVLAPFIQASRAQLPCSNDAVISGSEIHILPEGSLSQAPRSTTTSSWVACRLHHLGEVPDVQQAIDILTAGGSHAWRVGWSKSDDLANSRTSENFSASGVVAPNGIRITAGLTAILEVQPSSFQQVATLSYATMHASAAHLNRGDALTVVSSPYGLLSPRVFQNTVSRGVLANAVAPNSHALVPEPVEHDHYTSQVSPEVMRHLEHLMASTDKLVARTSVREPSALLATDARCLPGSEGGAVYDTNGRWIGMVTLPLAMTDGSAVDLNLVITADVLLPWLNEYCLKIPQTPHQILPAPAPNKSAEPAESEIPFFAGERGVVLIRIGSTWGSGIVVSSAGHILTNAHLLKSYLVDLDQTPSLNAASTAPSLDSFGDARAAKKASPPKNSSRTYEPPALLKGTSIFIRLLPFHYETTSADRPRARWARASLVYLSRGAWDVALLKLQPSPEAALFVLPRQVRPAETGQQVLVVGFPLFAPRTGLRASVTAGIVSRVVQWHSSNGQRDPLSSRPLLLVTDAVVHNGNSGGALVAVAKENGVERLELLGMVTSNVRHSRRALVQTEDSKTPVEREISSIIPSLNFSIPIECLKPLWDFVDSNDVKYLHELDNTSAQIGALWSLFDDEFAPVPSRPQPVRTLPPEVAELQRQRDSMRSAL